MWVSVGVKVGVGVGVSVLVPVGSGVGGPVSVGVGEGPGVPVSVGPGVGVMVGVCVLVGRGVSVGVSVAGITDSGSTPGGTMMMPGCPLPGGVTTTTSGGSSVGVGVKVAITTRGAFGSWLGCWFGSTCGGCSCGKAGSTAGARNRGVGSGRKRLLALQPRISIAKTPSAINKRWYLVLPAF